MNNALAVISWVLNRAAGVVVLNSVARRIVDAQQRHGTGCGP
jgi:hypothetical protein